MAKINRTLIIYTLTVFGVSYYFLRKKRRVAVPIKPRVVQEKVEAPLPVYEKKKNS